MFWQDIHGGLVQGAMVDQREALADSIWINDTVYLVRPYLDLNRPTFGQQPATLHFTTKLSGT